MQPDNDFNNEAYWEEFKKRFVLSKEGLDLRAHAASPVTKQLLEKLLHDYNDIQSFPSLKNAEFEAGEKEPLRAKIAAAINSSTKEVALMRNTTEALNNAIMGFPFQKGDEVLASVHEYDSMMGSLYQRKIKEGITIKPINIPYRPSSKEEIIAAWEKNITEKTKLFLIYHMVWISGQIYPVKELCALARKHNIKTVIDAAQSFSHINIDVKEMDCDYLGASLHKWCAAPLGTGFLFVKEEQISVTYPLLGGYQYLPDDVHIEKFENFGTITPVFRPAVMSIDLWNTLGSAVKSKRMQELKTYWTESLKNDSAIEIVSNTSADDSCGIAYFTVKGKSSKQLKEELWKQFKINVQAVENYKTLYVDYKNVNAVGVATPVFVTKKELDYFLSSIRKLL